jgi:CO/xanthine dehydrogenase FAD-binding subunit
VRLSRPASVEEALRHLEADRDGARFYAGGLEVVFALRTRALERCTSLIDTKRIRGAVGVSRTDGHVRIGPATRHHAIATDPVVAADLPLLGLACGRLGTMRIRVQGTIGGNFGHGHQHTDPGTAAVVHGGWVELAATGGRRSVPIEEFWTGPYQVARGRDELIESIRLRPLGAGWVVVHDRVELLHRPPTAIVSMAGRVEDGRLAEVRIGVGGVPPRPMRLSAVERLLVGCGVGEVRDALAAAEPLVDQAVAAAADDLGSAEFKVCLLTGLVRRAAGRLLDRHGGERVVPAGGR